MVGDRDADVGVGALRDLVGDDPREAVVELPAVVRVDVVAPLVALLVALALDDEPPRRRDAVRAGVADLLVVEPRQRVDGVLVDGEAAEPLADRRRAAGLGALEQLGLELEHGPAEVVGEREPLGEPRRDRGALVGPVDVDVRPPAVAVLEPVAAEQQHVAGLEGVEVGLVEAADPLAALAGQHRTRERVGDGADVLHVDDAGEPAPPADQPGARVVLVVVVLAAGRVVGVPPDLRVDVPGLEAGVVRGEVAHELLPLVVGVLAVRVGPAERRAHVGLALDAVDGHAVDVLGGDVLGALGDEHAVDEPLLGLLEHHRTLDELVAVERDDAAGDGVARGVAGAADPLEQRRDGLRAPDLDHEVERRHVDAELEARRGGDDVDLAALEPLLDVLADVGGERAVVAARVRLAVVVGVALSEVEQHPLGARARVREDERGVVGLDPAVEPLVEPVGDLVAGRADEVGHRADQLEVVVADEPGVDDVALAGRAAVALAADEELGHRLERLDGRRAADARRRRLDEVLEALEAHREVGAALVGGEAVDLVDDDVLDGRELLAEPRGVEQDGERLGRRVEDVRRLLEHPLAVVVVGVAVADGVADLHGLAVGDGRQRDLEVPVDVVGERPQRRDVEAVDGVLEPAGRARGGRAR